MKHGAEGSESRRSLVRESEWWINGRNRETWRRTPLDVMCRSAGSNDSETMSKCISVRLTDALDRTWCRCQEWICWESKRALLLMDYRRTHRSVENLSVCLHQCSRVSTLTPPQCLCRVPSSRVRREPWTLFYCLCRCYFIFLVR